MRIRRDENQKPTPERQVTIYGYGITDDGMKVLTSALCDHPRMTQLIEKFFPRATQHYPRHTAPIVQAVICGDVNQDQQ